MNNVLIIFEYLNYTILTDKHYVTPPLLNHIVKSLQMQLYINEPYFNLRDAVRARVHQSFNTKLLHSL
jgi:hypothetical protein